VKRLNSFIFTYLIDFFNTKTGFQQFQYQECLNSIVNSGGGGRDKCDAKDSIAFCTR